MSKKRKLESLQQLGILKPQDVKELQSKMNPAYRVEASRLGWHNVRWLSLAVAVALGWGSIATTVAVAWRLSH